MKPLVSVVIPTHNRKQILKRALDSVFAQTVPEVEVIVVDDGSTDGTDAMVADYPRRVVYVPQPNAGPAAARNQGLARARGEAIAFLDSDDLYLPRHLEAALAVLDREPEAGLVYGANEVVDAEGRVAKVQRPRPENRGWVLPRLLLYNFVMPSTVVMRRACYERVGPMDERLRFAEDWLYWLRIAAHFPFDYVGEVLVRFQRSEESLSRRPLRDLAAANHAMFDLAFADADLGPKITPYRARAYAAMYQGYAAEALESFDRSTARSLIRRSLAHRPLEGRSYGMLVKTVLPRALLAKARAVARGKAVEIA